MGIFGIMVFQFFLQTLLSIVAQFSSAQKKIQPDFAFSDLVTPSLLSMNFSKPAFSKSCGSLPGGLLVPLDQVELIIAIQYVWNNLDSNAMNNFYF